MLSSLIAAGSAVGLWLGASGVGRRAGIAWFGDDDRVLATLAAPVLGLALMAIGSLALFLLPGTPIALHAAIPTLGLMLAWSQRMGLRDDWRAVRAELGSAAVFVFGLAGMAALVLLPFALGPVVDWDSLTFHDRVMQQFIAAGTLFVPEDNLHVAQLGLAHLATAPLRALGVGNAGTFVSTMSTALAVVVGGVAAGRIAGTLAARLAAAALVGTPLLLLVGMTPRVDAPLTLAVLLVLLSVGSDVHEGSGRRIGWSLVCAAIAAGTKYHGLAFAVVMGLPLLGALRFATPRRVMAGVAVGLALVAPWLVLNQVHFGAPLFPFFAPPLLEPWLAGVVGSPSLPATFDAAGLNLMPTVRESFHPWHFMFSPQRLTLESEGAWYRPSLLLLLIPLALWIRPRRLAVMWCGVPLAYAAIVLVVSPATSPRYLLPAVIPLLIAVAAGTTQLLHDRWEHRATLLGWVLVLLALGQSLVFLPSWLTPGVVTHAVGSATAQEFRASHPDVTVRRFAEIPGILEAAVPPTGVLLMLFEARGGGIDRRVLADSRAASWPVLAQTTSVQRCLEGTGITHVLLNLGALDYYLARGASPDALQVDQLRTFLGSCTTSATEQAGFVLFQLGSKDAAAGGTQ